MEEEEHKFASAEEEGAYWKEMAIAYKRSLEDCREELDEFQTSSRELEAELEAQLEGAEGKTKELTSSNQRLQNDVEILKQKLENLQTQSHMKINELEDENAQYKGFKEELQRYIRELEQTNDDLERGKRSTVVSLEDFEGRLNLAIERNAFLESELEERESLSITVQRLKDEARDLRQEMQRRNTPKLHQPSEEELTLAANENAVRAKKEAAVDSNKLIDNEFVTPNTTPSKIPNGSTNTPLTPSARISALNIVGDLLRKVGALESKLASCRNFVKDQPRGNNNKGLSSPINSPRAKRPHRGMGASGIPQPGQSAAQNYANVKIAV